MKPTAIRRGREDHPHCVVRTKRGFGRAVYAKAPIRAGETVAVFDGPFLDENFTDWTDDLRNHAIQYAKNAWRDSIGIARYVNHSCEPNCGIKNYFSVVAMRDIAKGEQITWDYEMTEKSTWWRMHCRCGTPSCRGKIGNYANMPRAVRAKYKGFISEWLTKK